MSKHTPLILLAITVLISLGTATQMADAQSSTPTITNLQDGDTLYVPFYLLEGTAPANSDVRIDVVPTIPTSNAYYFTTTADSSGAWSKRIAFDADLYTITATANSVSSVPITVTVSFVNPTPTITSTLSGVTDQSTIPMTVTFDHSVYSSGNNELNFDIDDIKIKYARVSNFAGFDKVYTFDIEPVFDATISVNIKAGATAGLTGLLSNAASEFTIEYKNAITPNYYAVDVVISGEESYNTALVPLVVTFSKPITGFEVSDVIVTNGDAVSISKESDLVYTLNIHPKNPGKVTVYIPQFVVSHVAVTSNADGFNLNLQSAFKEPTPLVNNNRISNEFAFISNISTIPTFDHTGSLVSYVLQGDTSFILPSLTCNDGTIMATPSAAGFPVNAVGEFSLDFTCVDLNMDERSSLTITFKVINSLVITSLSYGDTIKYLDYDKQTLFPHAVDISSSTITLSGYTPTGVVSTISIGTLPTLGSTVFTLEPDAHGFWSLIVDNLDNGSLPLASYYDGNSGPTFFLQISTDPVPDPVPDPPKKKKSSSDNNDWAKAPTFGSHHLTYNQQVDYGFIFNGNMITIVNNYHVDVEKFDANVGNNTATIKVFAQDPLRNVSLHLGIPTNLDTSGAEVKIELLISPDSTETSGYMVKQINHHQDEQLVDEAGTFAAIHKVNCNDTDSMKKCYAFAIDFRVMAPLLYDYTAISAYDVSGRSQTTFINDGIEFHGAQLSEPKTHTISYKLGSQHDVKYHNLEQTDRRNNIWMDQHGHIYTHNAHNTWKQISVGELNRMGLSDDTVQYYSEMKNSLTPVSLTKTDPDVNVVTRIHSSFGGMIQDEKAKALQVFDTTKDLKQYTKTIYTRSVNDTGITSALSRDDSGFVNLIYDEQSKALIILGVSPQDQEVSTLSAATYTRSVDDTGIVSALTREDPGFVNLIHDEQSKALLVLGVSPQDQDVFALSSDTPTKVTYDSDTYVIALDFADGIVSSMTRDDSGFESLLQAEHDKAMKVIDATTLKLDDSQTYSYFKNNSNIIQILDREDPGFQKLLQDEHDKALLFFDADKLTQQKYD